MRFSSIRTRVSAILLVVALMIPVGGCVLQTQSTGPTVLHIAYRPAVADLKPLIAAFERENPGVTVDIFESDGTNAPSLLTELQAGNIDVVRDYRSTMYTMVRNGTFLPLDGVLESSDWGKVRQDYFTGSWEGLQVNGKQYAVPAGLDVYVAYVNLDAFTAAGVHPPTTAWTVNDLLVLASQVNQPVGTPGETQGVVYGFGTYYRSADPIIFSYLHGGGIVDDFDHPTKVLIADPKTVEATKWYADLILKYKVSPKAGIVSAYFRSGGITTAENQGFCAMWFSTFSSRGGPIDTPWPFKWQMLPLPLDSQAMSLGDVDGYYIPANSKHQQEALKLIRYLSDQWQESGVRFPVRKSLATNPRFQQLVGVDEARIGALAAENLIVMPQFYGRGGGGQIFQDYFSALFQILETGADPQTALEAAQKTADARLLQLP
jgi:ABC-type glycerol-3-phosphate transport system substrate-binding protein